VKGDIRAMFGWDLEALEEQGTLAIIERQPSYSITMYELKSTAKRIGARRAAVDSVPALFSSYPNELQPTEMRSAFHLLCQVSWNRRLGVARVRLEFMVQASSSARAPLARLSSTKSAVDSGL